MCTTRRFLLLPGAVLYAAVAMAIKHKKTAGLFALCFAGILWAAGGGVDDPANFELDGNVVINTTGQRDWGTAPTCPTGAVCSFVTDPDAHGDNILTGGGTKDINDFGQWLWKQTNTTSVQDKDDLIHVGAAAVPLANGHTGVYFFADRFSNSGDSQVGFWFVGDSTVGINNNASGGASGGFSGHHQDGDFWIVAHFLTGGAAPEIEVLKWVGGATGSLTVASASNAEKCDPSGVNTKCAIVNGADGVPAIAGFLDKNGSSTYGHGEFMEGGIDLQATFGNVPCISTFFAETRSSQSLTATLSDFSIPAPFKLCGISIDKHCTGASLNTNDSPETVSYGFRGTVTNTGIGTLFSVAVADVTPSNFVAGTLVGPTVATLPDTCTVNGAPTPCLQSGHVVTYSGSYKTSSVGGINHVNATAGSAPGGTDAKANADWPFDSTSGQPTECPLTVTKGLTLTKHCAACLQTNSSTLKVHITVSGTVCNTGNTDLNGVTVTDTTVNGATTVFGPTKLAVGACQPFTDSYDPGALPTGGNSPCSFTDTVSATGTVPSAFCSSNCTATATPVDATCALCTDNSCALP